MFEDKDGFWMLWRVLLVCGLVGVSGTQSGGRAMLGKGGMCVLGWLSRLEGLDFVSVLRDWGHGSVEYDLEGVCGKKCVLGMLLRAKLAVSER